MKENGPTSEGIKKYLDNLKDFDGVTGKLSFNKEHDVVRAGTEGLPAGSQGRQVRQGAVKTVFGFRLKKCRAGALAGP